MSKALALAALLCLAAAPAAAQVANPTSNPSQVPGTKNSGNKTGAEGVTVPWPSGTPSLAQVQEVLKADGYSDIRDLQRSGEGWTAQADFRGKPVAVAVDRTGKVTRR